jgi:AraC family transcriptional regulator of adaptative response / DNA-3-methyladenine glycosylase II
MAAGFGSVRRFNETFQALYGRAPSELRRRKVGAPGETVRISLTYRPPYDWDAILAALAARGAVDEMVSAGAWTRVLRTDVDGTQGAVSVGPGAAGRLAVEARIGQLKALPGVLARVRRVFDLAADPEAIARDLAADCALKGVIAARPGLRPPGDWIDAGEDAPSDRLAARDAGLAERAERWRPWRAYGALYWNVAKEMHGEQAA